MNVLSPSRDFLSLRSKVVPQGRILSALLMLLQRRSRIEDLNSARKSVPAGQQLNVIIRRVRRDKNKKT